MEDLLDVALQSLLSVIIFQAFWIQLNVTIAPCWAREWYQNLIWKLEQDVFWEILLLTSLHAMNQSFKILIFQNFPVWVYLFSERAMLRWFFLFTEFSLGKSRLLLCRANFVLLVHHYVFLVVVVSVLMI